MKQGSQYSLDGSISTADGQDIHLLGSHCRKRTGYTCRVDHVSVDRRLILVQDVQKSLKTFSVRPALRIDQHADPSRPAAIPRQARAGRTINFTLRRRNHHIRNMA